MLHDLLGLSAGTPPKFVRQYASLRGEILEAVGRYASEVRDGAFPTEEHTYPMSADEERAYLDG